MNFREFEPAEMALRDRHQLLIGGVAPRPIAFVGSKNRAGVTNLAPFSFFNAFGSNPPYVGFSPAYSGRTGKPKDTFRNVKATGEFTVSIVSHAMVEQMHLASGEYPPGVDEFDISGFTPLPSVKVAPPAVAESPFIMECTLHKALALGGQKASGNLLVGQVVYFRVKEEVFDADGRIDPLKMDQVARLGFNWYTRTRSGLFTVPKRQGETAAGFGALPEHLLTSTELTGNDLARMAGVVKKPDTGALIDTLREIHGKLDKASIHRRIKLFIQEGRIDEAWALAELFEQEQE